MKSVLEILEATESFLARKGFESPRSDAQWLLAHVLGMKRLDLYVNFERPLTDDELERMRAYLRRRAAGEPVQYIVGSTAFHTIELEIGPGALIPRPETERLVELALAAYPGEGPILDLCTGSGAIALSLGSEIASQPCVTGVDISPEALAWAERNRQRLQLAHVQFVEGDLFAPVKDEPFAMITANPPYVTTGEYKALPKDVHDHEPKLALEAGEDGLTIIQRIAGEGLAHLQPGGWLFMEIGETQGKPVAALLSDSGWSEVAIHQDYTQRDRVAVARKSPA